jgi:hypothetical protein
MDMICSARPRLAENLCIQEKGTFSMTCYTYITNIIRRRNVFIKDALNLSSEWRPRKDYIFVMGLEDSEASYDRAGEGQ